MAPRATRSKAATIVVAPEIPTPQLICTENEPHKLFILPKGASDDARMILLRNPATASLCRYFYCSKLGLFEFTKVSAPRTTPRSCLISSEAECQPGVESQGTSDVSSRSIQDGYILQDADFFVAIPLDPIFLITPILRDSAGMYQPADDYLDQLCETSDHMDQLLRRREFRALLARRIRAVSEVQDIGGGEEVCKPQLSLFSKVLTQKATRGVLRGWPASMEESLVRKEVEIPVAPILNDEDDSCEMIEAGEDGAGNKTAPAKSAVVKTSSVPANVMMLMRERVALDYMISAYVPPSLIAAMESHISKSSLIDFQPLAEHLERVKKAKTEVQALRALSDNISRKRSALEDDEAAEARAEKKRKKDEEENKKKLESRAIKQLKKVDTTGMKKLSSFFTKPPPQTRSQKAPS